VARVATDLTGNNLSTRLQEKLFLVDLVKKTVEVGAPVYGVHELVIKPRQVQLPRNTCAALDGIF
jgi:hypothetical protein